MEHSVIPWMLVICYCLLLAGGVLWLAWMLFNSLIWEGVLSFNSTLSSEAERSKTAPATEDGDGNTRLELPRQQIVSAVLREVLRELESPPPAPGAPGTSRKLS